jgi:hypothetical protein
VNFLHDGAADTFGSVGVTSVPYSSSMQRSRVLAVLNADTGELLPLAALVRRTDPSKVSATPSSNRFRFTLAARFIASDTRYRPKNDGGELIKGVGHGKYEEDSKED